MAFQFLKNMFKKEAEEFNLDFKGLTELITQKYQENRSQVKNDLEVAKT